MKYLFPFLFLALGFTSCVNQRQYSYFKDVPDTARYYAIADTGFNEPVIKPDDVVQVNISSPNPEATSFFITPGNPAPPVAGSNVTPAAPNTYIVDKEGNIHLPLVGAVQLQNLTTAAARQLIAKRVAEYLKDPIVTVRFYNFKVTVLGEVTRPASYVVPNERVSVLDALGMAGDLTIYGKRENILLIREAQGKKVMTRLNLNSSNIFNSPFFYLQQNDIIYVEPNKAKIAGSDMAQVRTISIISSLLSLAIIIATRL